MIRLLKPFLKLPIVLRSFRISLNKNNFKSVNLYFQDESRFGLKTHIGRCLTSRGVKPIAQYQHAFKNTYLYGSFSPINGDQFVYEIEGTSSEIFYNYLLKFSEYKPEEVKLLIIDNAGFHSLSKYKLPENIRLIKIPPYSPEINPCEKIWHFIKSRFKNSVFKTLENVKKWLHEFIKENLNSEIVKSITHHSKYLDIFKACFNI
jgi:transposase